MKLLLFRAILLLIVVIIFEIIGYAGMWVQSHSLDFLSNRNYFRIRAMLLGNNDPEMLPRYLSLPYLGYVPFPEYKSHGLVQHNEDGYRGVRIPLQKADKFRVLCIGGSTTYGFGVDSPSQTFPAQLQVLLNDHIIHDSILGRKFNGAEVLNAGLEAGTSAEELQQYLFKYRYYKPDAVIVHSGINDAMVVTSTSADFQPDYTHYRRIIFHLEALPPPGSWLMRSYFLSFISIRLFYNDFSGTGDEFNHQAKATFCRWSDLSIDSVIKNKSYDYYPFYKNSKSLYEQVSRDSSLLFIIPCVLNENSEFVKSNKKYNDVSKMNADLSKSLAESAGGVFIPFDYASIKDTSCWIGDDCHLNARGEKEKAQILFSYIANALSPETKKSAE